MSTPHDARQEYGGTYFVQDRSNEEELTRVALQDQMLTTGMGGVLPEQRQATSLQRVLDVGCGTGSWLIEAAKRYEGMTQLVGVDVSERMIEYAREQAEAQQVSERVQFRTMDALQMLEFPTDYFDLVNQRFGVSFLRTWEWPKLLHEYQRVTRPGGVIRITETDILIESNSPAFARLNSLFLKALTQAGYLFTPNRYGVINELARLLERSGWYNVQTRAHALVFRAGTPQGQIFFEDIKHAYRTLVPFLRKWTSLPDDYEELYQQALGEMQQPDFEATWNLLTSWGIKTQKRTKGVPEPEA